MNKEKTVTVCSLATEEDLAAVLDGKPLPPVSGSADKPPPRKSGWDHSDQVLVYYAHTEEQCGTWGIAYFHYKPPFKGKPCWVDFAHNGRAPSFWWRLPSTPND